MILHLCGRADWDAALSAGAYKGDTLATEGFVHCSDPGTLHLPANRLFAGRDDLVVLVIDPARLDVDLRWEPGDPTDAEEPWFPHVYGPIPASAVVDVRPYPPAADGRFQPINPR